MKASSSRQPVTRSFLYDVVVCPVVCLSVVSLKCFVSTLYLSRGDNIFLILCQLISQIFKGSNPLYDGNVQPSLTVELYRELIFLTDRRPSPDILGQRPVRPSSVLWVYGDSVSEQFYWGVRSDPLCTHVFKWCGHTYNWVYQLKGKSRTSSCKRFKASYSRKSGLFTWPSPKAGQVLKCRRFFIFWGVEMVIGSICSRDLFEASWEGLHEVLPIFVADEGRMFTCVLSLPQWRFFRNVFEPLVSHTNVHAGCGRSWQAFLERFLVEMILTTMHTLRPSILA